MNFNSPTIMGILNVTPDSFSDGSMYNSLDAALTDNEQKINTVAKIKYKAKSIAENLPEFADVDDRLTVLLEQMEQLAFNGKMPRSPVLRDEMLSFGERIASLLLTACFVNSGASAREFDVRQVMKTNSLYGKAVVDIQTLKLQCKDRLVSLTEKGVIVTQGFIGQDGLGHTTTLGRGGSDYSAALLAEALEASDLSIWTDVVGIFTTDPRITDQARAIKEISFGEAAEMATFGAKILHPATLIPAMRQNIPVFVGSSKEPEKGGTKIQQEVESNPTYRSISLRREQTLVTVKSPAMLHANGFLAKVFTILAKHDLSVDLITTSEISVALTFDNPTGTTQALITSAVVEELEQMCEVSVEHGLSLVAVIGNGLHAAKGIGRSVFDKINNFNIRMICHGASANNLCFLVPENDANTVVEQLHNTLFA
mgnify:CR=1 FL=1